MTTALNKPLTFEKSSDMRSSGVEILRIIAMVLIVWRHSIQTAMNIIDMSSMSFINVLLLSTADVGEVGNALFVICSAYFLADSKGARSEKAIKILLDSMSISIFIFLCMTIAGYRFSDWEIVWQFLPDIKKKCVVRAGLRHVLSVASDYKLLAEQDGQKTTRCSHRCDNLH